MSVCRGPVVSATRGPVPASVVAYIPWLLSTSTLLTPSEASSTLGNVGLLAAGIVIDDSALSSVSVPSVVSVTAFPPMFFTVSGCDVRSG